MNAEICPATVRDIPALLPLVEQYWVFEDIARFDAARGNDRAGVFYRAHGYGARAGFDILDKMLPDRRSG